MRTAQDIMDQAVGEHNPVAILCGFSGGTDSLAVTHWVMQRYPQAMAFHANTGIGIEKTREFVRETCKAFDWPLMEIRAKEDCGQDYDQMVLEYGFPGPAHHRKMYQRLKERCVRVAMRRLKSHRMDRVLICTGIRSEESQIRAGYADRVVNRTGSQVWVNPIYHWSGSEKAKYIRDHNLPTNPVSQALGMSGECLCGAFAHKGELALVRIIDPDVAARIDRLAEEAKVNGHAWGWEESPPKGGRKAADMSGTMCVGCSKGGRGSG